MRSKLSAQLFAIGTSLIPGVLLAGDSCNGTVSWVTALIARMYAELSAAGHSSVEIYLAIQAHLLGLGVQLSGVLSIPIP